MVKMVMLCKSITEQELIKGDWQDWYAQAKLDGTRCLFIKEGKSISLISRDNNEYTERYPEIVEQGKNFPDCILDGELTFFNQDNKDIFLTSLATKETIKEYGVKPKLMVFDILQLNGVDITKQPLMRRKLLLNETVCGDTYIEVLPYHEDAITLWEVVKAGAREGLILKHKSSPYTSIRSKYWLKCKNFKVCVLIIMKMTC